MNTKYSSMAEFESAKASAWAEHHKKFDCEHEHKAVRVRTISNGSTQYVPQCLRCGKAVGNPLKKDSCTGIVTKPFDVALYECFEDDRQIAAEQVSQAFDRDAFIKPYDDYLSSDAWANMRRKVMNRAKDMCEGCGSNPATEVHHLTYAHVGHEFMFELLALCNSCHERIHE